MKKIQKYMIIVGFISLSSALSAARLLGTEGMGSSTDKIAQLQQHIDTNNARLQALKAEGGCEGFVPTSVECAVKAAEKAGLMAQNLVLEASKLAIKNIPSFGDVSKLWHSDVAKNIVIDNDIAAPGIVYGDQYGDTRYRHRGYGDEREYYRDYRYENREPVGGVVEGTVNAVEDVGAGVGAAVEDVGVGIGSFFSR